MRWRGASALVAVIALMGQLGGATANAAFRAEGGVLPLGTELDNEALNQPREVFHSEAIGGRKSYLVKLGDAAFNAPALLGGAARHAGMSCNICHINGTFNPRLFVPGMSLRPGTFDTTGPIFNPLADNGVNDAVTTPSLRGARFLQPYGHDGRIASLRDFVRNVIVNEFSGAEPTPAVLDALVAYIEDIDFLPNRRLGPGGKLVGHTTDTEKRGEALFYRPFPHDPALSCAVCHIPSGAFVDHRQHDVGSDGLFKTPTLRNANFNAPYFHDGRYRSYAEVVTHFDRVFYLGLSVQDRRDLVSYLAAIGDGEEPYVAESVDVHLQEIDDFVSVLDSAIPAKDVVTVALVVAAVNSELRDLAERFPARKDSAVEGGQKERAKARGAVREAVLSLRRLEVAVNGNGADAAMARLSEYRHAAAAAASAMKDAEPWSLFNPGIAETHRSARQQLYRAGIDPALAARRRPDLDD
jgi:Di-haem cytochrome c peroxidase